MGIQKDNIGKWSVTKEIWEEKEKKLSKLKKLSKQTIDLTGSLY